MNFQQIAQLNDIHRRQMERQAEADRLANAVQQDARSHHHHLATLGRQMVEIGQRLQAHAAETKPKVALQP